MGRDLEGQDSLMASATGPTYYVQRRPSLHCREPSCRSATENSLSGLSGLCVRLCSPSGGPGSFLRSGVKGVVTVASPPLGARLAAERSGGYRGELSGQGQGEAMACSVSIPFPALPGRAGCRSRRGTIQRAPPLHRLRFCDRLENIRRRTFPGPFSAPSPSRPSGFPSSRTHERPALSSVGIISSPGVVGGRLSLCRVLLSI